jgi:hypothetical protein
MTRIPNAYAVSLAAAFMWFVVMGFMLAWKRYPHPYRVAAQFTILAAMVFAAYGYAKGLWRPHL